MTWNDNLTNLNYVLAGLYPLTQDSYRIVDEAGIPRTHVSFRARAIDNWYEILSEAKRRGKVINIIRAARNDYSENPNLELAERGELISATGPLLDKDLTWKSQEPADTLEKIMGKQPTFLPISFLEIGLQRSRSVARVELPNGTGSGFLTSNNIFVTNHHVIPNKEKAKNAIIQFNYQKSTEDLDLKPTNFDLDPDLGFETSSEDDWTLVRVKGDANSDWGAINVNKISISSKDRVNIIQHPGGGPKQIALYHNIVAYTDNKRIQYLTDTMPGSSGSPVFDSQWRVVALHHSGGWIVEPGTKRQVYRNEGINVNCIVEVLKNAS